LLQESAKAQLQGDFPEAERLIQNAFAAAQKDKTTGMQALCQIQMGRLLGCENKFQEARAAFENGISLLHEKTELPSGLQRNLLSDGISGLADALMRNGDYDGAKEKLKQSIELVGTPGNIQDASVVVGAMNTLALIYGKEAKYQSVIETVQTALAIIPKLGDSHDALELRCKLLENLSNAYANIGDSAKATKTAMEALAICEAHQATLGTEMASCCRVIGVAHLSKQEYGKARLWAQKAFDYDEKYLGPDNSFLATDLDTLGLISIHQGRYSQARMEFEKALRILNKTEAADPRLIEHLRNRLAQVNTAMKNSAEPK